MKVWIKLFLGAGIGIALGIALPFQSNAVLARALEFLPELVLRIGRYAAPPLVFFSLAAAIFDLRSEGRFWGLMGKILLALIAIGALTLGFGLLVCRISFSAGRIPIIVESADITPVISIRDTILEIFPQNMLSSITGKDIFLLPLYAASFFLAIGLSYDKNFSKPVIQLIDSLSRIFFHIGAFFSEIMGLFIIVLAAYSTYNYRSVLARGIYSDFIRLILIITFTFSFVVLPLFLYLLRGKRQFSPIAKVYGSLGTAVAAFFSGDINFTLPVLFYQNKENLGVGRRVNAVATTMFATVGRFGSVMIAAVSFILVLQSYSSLEIQTREFFKVALEAFALAFLLGRNGGNGAFAALAALCAWAPDSFQTGYLILKPVSFILVACGTLIDCMIASLGSYFLAAITPDGVKEKTVKMFS